MSPCSVPVVLDIRPGRRFGSSVRPEGTLFRTSSARKPYGVPPVCTLIGGLSVPPSCLWVVFRHPVRLCSTSRLGLDPGVGLYLPLVRLFVLVCTCDDGSFGWVGVIPVSGRSHSDAPALPSSLQLCLVLGCGLTSAFIFLLLQHCLCF